MRLTSLIKYGTAVFVLLAVATAAGLTWLYQSLAAQNNALVYQAEFQRTVEELVELPAFLNEQPRRYVFNGDPAIKEAWQQAVASRPHERFAERLQETGAPQDELDLIASIAAEFTWLIDTHEQAFALVDAENKPEANMLLFSAEYNERLAGIAPALLELEEMIVVRTDRQAADAQEMTQRALVTSYSLIAVLALSMLVFAGLLMRKVTRSLPPLTKMMEELAAGGGDLTQRLPIHSNDEIGQIAKAFNRFMETLAAMVREVKETSEKLSLRSQEMLSSSGQIATATEQIAAAIQEVASGAAQQSSSTQATVASMDQLRQAIEQIARGAQDQARQVQETATPMEQMAASIHAISRSAQEVSEASEASLRTARLGGEAVIQTLEGMGRIHNSTEEVARHVEALNEQSARIGEIVKLISEIADQTNLLALNAAIEAARAGEHGRGFAVVADEVRKLAERSAASAQEITEILGSIRASVETAVERMHVGRQEVEAGSQQAERAKEALEQILEAIEETNRQMERITKGAHDISARSAQVIEAFSAVASVTEEYTAATEEMSASSELVERAIHDVSTVSHQTAASSEQASAAAEEVHATAGELTNSARALGEQANMLQQLMNRFKLDD